MNNFRVGQKVVVVTSGRPISPIDPIWEVSRPVRGDVVTVREIRQHPVSGETELLLHEHHNPVHITIRGPWEIGYAAVCFRPVAYPKQSLEHDIALFLDTPAHVRTSDKERA